MSGLGEARTYARDQFLFNAGDQADGFYLIRAGSVRVFRMDEQGREVEVARLGPGDFLGEAVIFISPEFPQYAQAVRESAVLFYPKDKVLKRIVENPQAARAFIALLAGKCWSLNKRIETLGLQTVRQRLAQYLLSRCSGDKKCEVELKMKKGDLARALGTINETLSRTLRQMKEEGLIEVRGNSITILDCFGLRSQLCS